MLRVCKPGGTIAMANWTPEGFIGQVFKTIGRHLPPPPGAQSPARWGTREAIEAMFGHGARSIELHPRSFAFRYRSPEHFVEVFRTWYGPTHKAFQALGEKAAGLEADIHAVLASLNAARDGSLVVPSEYVEVVIRKA
jgi:hypothetical protein